MNEKILFVDDEPSALDGFRRLLHGIFDVRVASSGGEGLVALEHDGPFAVVVSDMQMPGMRGTDFLARVRQRAPDTVRMMLTGHADLHSAMEAVNRGRILHFLTKPCPREVLLAAVNSGVDQYRSVQEERQLASHARQMQRSPGGWAVAAPADWDQFESPVGLPGPALAKSLLEPLMGRDTKTYTVLLRTPVLDTVEQRYGEAAATSYLTAVRGFLEHALSAGDQLFHWRREILLAVLHRYISPAAVRMEIERMVTETRSYVIEVQDKPRMVACLITFDLLPVAQFSEFNEWLAEFQSRCENPTSVAAP